MRIVAIFALALLSAASTAFVLRNGWTLYYGDAESHLDIARRILDARTPGYEQIGTVWLPLPHALMLPLVGNDELWRNGLAGAIPASVCFVIAGAFFFASVLTLFRSAAAAWAALGVLSLNPNLLYLQSTPMTEAVLLACLMALLFSTVRFSQTQSWWAVAGAGLAALAATLTRYEGWFLLPFVAGFFLLRGKKHMTAFLFLAIASLGPLYWLAHNWWSYGNPLEFYNGPYSAQAIYQRALDHGVPPYPGDHDWLLAAWYFSTAAELCIGWVALLLAALGLFAAGKAKAVWPVIYLLLPPVFYVWSMHSGGTPIYVPVLWPNSYYNTRYALSALPLIALCAGAVVLWWPSKRQAWAAAVIVAVSAAAASPVCWKESQVNSAGRRAWTEQAADYLRSEYRTGDGIFTSLGDLAGIYREAGIPLRETLNEGNRPLFLPTTRQPLLLLHEEWAVAMAGDPVASAVEHLSVQTGPKYELMKTIVVKAQPVIQIYRRTNPVGQASSFVGQASSLRPIINRPPPAINLNQPVNQ